MRKTSKALALLLTLLLALMAFAPTALAAPVYLPGVSTSSGSSTSLLVSNVSTGAMGSAGQMVTVTYNTAFTGEYYFNPVVLTFSLVGYTDGKSTGALTGVTASATNSVTATVSGTTLTVTYMPYMHGGTPFSVTLSGGAGNYAGNSSTLTILPQGTNYPTYPTPDPTDPTKYANTFTISLDQPAAIYAGKSYTLSAVLTSTYGGSGYYPLDYNSPTDLYTRFYVGSLSEGYYPYSAARGQVYTEAGWSAPVYGISTRTLAELSEMKITPKIYWSQALGYPTRPDTNTPWVNTSVQVSFLTDASSSAVSLSKLTDQSALFKADAPGTYKIRVTVPAGYLLLNGDGTTGSTSWLTQYDPNYFNPSNPYWSYYVYMAQLNTQKTYTITVLPADSSTTPTPPPAPAPDGNANLKGKVLKDGAPVYNAAGSQIGTIGKVDIAIYDTVGNRYRFLYNGGEGFIAKSLVNFMP